LIIQAPEENWTDHLANDEAEPLQKYVKIKKNLI